MANIIKRSSYVSELNCALDHNVNIGYMWLKCLLGATLVQNNRQVQEE